MRARQAVAPRPSGLQQHGGALVLPEPAQPAVQLDRSGALSLDNIRQALIRQEDSIIFSLIERSQFARNSPAYEPDSIPVPGYATSGRRYSLLEYLLLETEQLHGKMRRYTSPDEHAFFPDLLPALVLPPLTYSAVRRPRARDSALWHLARGRLPAEMSRSTPFAACSNGTSHGIACSQFLLDYFVWYIVVWVSGLSQQSGSLAAQRCDCQLAYVSGRVVA